MKLRGATIEDVRSDYASDASIEPTRLSAIPRYAEPRLDQPAPKTNVPESTRYRPAVQSFDAAAAATTEASLEKRKDEDEVFPFTFMPPEGATRLLAVLDGGGMTAFTPSTSGSAYGSPGEGNAQILDFGGDQIVYFSDTSTIAVYNLTLLPVSGGTAVQLILIGEYWFAFPVGVAVCHGIVTEDVQPCAGTTPGLGKVQLYIDQNGSMAPVGDPVQVDNWYSVTGGAGTYCTVTSADGTLSLIALDCSS